MSLFQGVRIVVQPHAVYQFALRFRPETPTNQKDLEFLDRIIADEVRSALDAHRVSNKKPLGLRPPDDPDCIYAWTEDETRVYALRFGEPNIYAVMTTMKPQED